jgi:hypothetical protein
VAGAGTWAQVPGAAGDAPFAWVTRANGSLLVTLTTDASSVEDVLYAKADIVLAAGAFASERLDVRISAEGLYVRATGELRLLVTQSHVFADITEAEAAAGGDAYRTALAEAAAEAAELYVALQERGARTRLPRLSQQQADTSKNATGLRRRCAFRLTAKLPASAADWHGRPSVHLLGSLDSADCHVALRLNASLLHTAELTVKANNAALLAALMAMVMISVTARQMEACAAGSAMTKVSLACLCHQSVLDSFACLLHLTGGLMVDALFSSFFSTAICFFVLFSLFEMRWMMLVWRARTPDAPWRQELNALQTKYYIALVGAACYVWFAGHSPVALSAAYGSFWTWQIAHSAVTDAVRALTPRYIIGISLARLAMPLYILACPENWLSVVPRPHIATSLVLWVALQAAVLCAQYRFGARCFVPPCWRPVKYSYNRPATPAERAAAVSNDAEGGAAGTVDCIICLLPLDLDAPQERFLTPCGHAFHAPCLNRWLEVKQECPTCRRALPLP